MNFDPKNRQHVLLLVAAIVVGIFLGDRLVRAPLWNAWKARSVRLADLQKKVGDGEMLLKRGDSLLARWDNMRTNALPADTAAAESVVMRAFNRWADASGVSVSGIRPQWKRADEDYMTLECRADIAGDLNAITRFLYEIEHDPLGVKVDSADLATRDTDGRQITLGLQISGLQLLKSAR
ncbi:MAG TPA: hypothetical protein VFV96_14555 [Verrucomicrobiae bacterium]|nr:hypothetical protein [Verrucomicrobiae bacterium]